MYGRRTLYRLTEAELSNGADWPDDTICAYLDNAPYVFCRQAEPELTCTRSLPLLCPLLDTLRLNSGRLLPTVICSMGTET